MIGLHHFLTVSAVLFSLGIFAVITNKNAIVVLMGIELILNSANLNFIAFSRYRAMNMDGQLFAIFVIIMAAAEAAVALAIVLNIYFKRETVDLSEMTLLKK